ncbi:MAG TPA: AbrB/MazE/SpoVT family DNA-binding domain-containing protein [Isosphaeraceae bacterium]|jgi:antitoxin component of MazEF toxin-antitoxin module|nr:AbrB/MazE/SpoVT family DNA-binding domain-containing protein [Isosphaeraceae bacterium]
MIKTLTPIGNSLGLIIDKAILELLKIDRNTKLEVTTDGKGLHIRPVSEDHHERVMAAARRVMTVHAEDLRKLAE